jgi:hypothetical protein
LKFQNNGELPCTPIVMTALHRISLQYESVFCGKLQYLSHIVPWAVRDVRASYLSVHSTSFKSLMCIRESATEHWFFFRLEHIREKLNAWSYDDETIDLMRGLLFCRCCRCSAKVGGKFMVHFAACGDEGI